MKFLRTQDMEGATRLLCSNYPSVIVQMVRYTTRPVRFRVNKIADLAPYLGRYAEGGDGQIERFNERGGLLMNYRKEILTIPHDAQLVAEPPLSTRTLDRNAAHCARLSVVYQPASWTRHMAEAARIHPAPERVRAVQEAIVPPSEKQAAIAERLGIVGRLGVDGDTRGLTPLELAPVRRALMRGVKAKAYSRVALLTPRTPPAQAGLQEMYEAIQGLPEVNGTRLALGRVLSETARHWKQQMRALVKEGAVSGGGWLGFYRLDMIAPDYERIEKAHRKAIAQAEALAAFVDALPEFTAQTLHDALAEQSLPSSFPASPECEALPDGKAG